jgi:TRAP-type transport system periplasmic protein
VPLSILASDSYEAVQRGTADGRIMSWTGIPAFRFDEITKFHLEAPLGTAPGAVIINRATWEGLTPEARDIIMRNSGEALVREVAEFWIDETTSVRQAMIDAGHTVVSPSPEQLANWRERTSPIREAWVAATPDGADVMERLNNFVADYRGNR